MGRTTFAIIGLGLAVEPHVKSLLDLSDRVEVLYAVTRSEKRAQQFSQKYSLPVSTDMQAAIGDPAVDVVLILTPPHTHLEICELAYAHGKNVLIEKPLDVSLERAQRIVQGASRAGVSLGVVLQHRFRQSSLRLAQILEKGELGSIQSASMMLPWWRAQEYYDEPGRGTRARDGGGVLMTQAIHTLDLFRSLVGPVKVVASHSGTTALHDMETEDCVAALLRIADSAPATMMATTAFYPGLPESIEILGSKGTARIIGSSLQVNYLSGDQEELHAEAGTGSNSNPMDFPHDAHRRLIEDYLDALGNGRKPLVCGEEAMLTQRLIEDLLA
ncbi:Gfo/Idh/MocA family protein [Litchfieldella xinjiangensis]|uniref:Gfo/Idh/MocA family protein n=1 Tax=Litchfieldella xinjiangensis TaxID=1166948 RepID=UPI0005BD0F3F|nr:Gfo/Idh/MocA family oxidoreductase [Halomonas xinjiangensis]